MPFYIFLFGWLKLYLAGILTAVLLYPTYLLLKQAPLFWVPNFTSKAVLGKTVVIIAIILTWVYFSGIGCFSFQNLDHMGRNGVFEALVHDSWPIRFSDLGNTPLVYYFGYWLPAAVVGKLFGVSGGFIMQYIWAVMGIALVYNFICVRNQKLVIWPLLILIFFSGADVLTYLMDGTSLGQTTMTQQLEWGPFFQYSSFTTQLYWVFNQALPAWLGISVILNLKDNRQIIALWGLMLLETPMSFVGILPYVIYFIVKNGWPALNDKGHKVIQLIKSVISYENLVVGGVAGIISFLFLSSNQASQHLALNLPKNRQAVLWLLLQILTEVLIYMIPIWFIFKGSPLYYLTLGLLLIFPLFKLNAGLKVDFTMRASIPALFVMYTLFIRLLDQLAQNRRTQSLLITMLVIFALGAVTPTHEILRSVDYSILTSYKPRQFSDNQRHVEYKQPIEKAPDYANLILGRQQSAFFRYLAR